MVVARVTRRVESMRVEGKTKVVERTASCAPGEVILSTKDSLTGGDAAKREHIEGIAAHKVTQACNVFGLLNARGVPTAFVRRHDERSLVCHECAMLPLELVTRRYAWGSALKREPGLAGASGRPHRFDPLRTELFHKHAVVMPPLVERPVQMAEDRARELYLRGGAWHEAVFTDPLVVVREGRWTLRPAKAPLDSDAALMEIPPVLSSDEHRLVVERLMRPVFSILEEAWARIVTADGPVVLADLKIEVGRRASDGALVVADVIDNDSWRIWPGGDPARQLDKQAFRDGVLPLAEVSEKYALVAALTERF
jgi:phosphoribosylaminoimidazole-succinocarboxamide synthase